MKQLSLLKKTHLSYGGTLLKTRKGRSHGRPLDSKNTMHLVLRSSKAKGAFSFKKAHNALAIERIINKFSLKYGIKVISLANVGNHLHFHIKLSSIHGYKPFIRAITSAICMHVAGCNRWQKSNLEGKFWDYRPFTRIVRGFGNYLNITNYIDVNKLEGLGIDRLTAYVIISEKRPSPLIC